MTDRRSFTPDGYVALVEEFLSRGYRVIDYSEVMPQEKHLILRHDIDFCPFRAVKMAQAECDLGVVATYFILISSRFYNIFSPEVAGCLQKIMSFGHRIGLHFDPQAYQTPDTGVVRERQALEAVTEQDILVMSFHRPHKNWLNSPQRIDNLMHTYEPRYFSEIGYVSDSRGDWHYGHPLDHPVLSDGHALQLLTHPIWWMHKMPEDHTPTDVLLRFANEQNTALHESISENCTSFAPPNGTV